MFLFCYYGPIQYGFYGLWTIDDGFLDAGSNEGFNETNNHGTAPEL